MDRKPPTGAPRLTVRCLAVLALTGLGVLGMGVGMPATAETATEVVGGWWTAAAPAAGVPGVLAAPDAPADGLVVQGGSPEVGPVSYAALAFAYEPGNAPTTLKLPLASGAVAVGTALRACIVTGAVWPAQGAPLADGPTYDCTRSTPATVAGDAVTFDVTELETAPGELKVALLADGPSDRMVFAKPTVDVLALTAASAAAPDNPPLANPAQAPAAVTPEQGAVPETFQAEVKAGPPAAAAGLPAAAPPLTALPPVQATQPLAATPVDRHGSRLLALLAAAGLLLAVVLWGAASAGAGVARVAPVADEGPSA
jgi:hypothetical protein